MKTTRPLAEVTTNPMNRVQDFLDFATVQLPTASRFKPNPGAASFTATNIKDRFDRDLGSQLDILDHIIHAMPHTDPSPDPQNPLERRILDPWPWQIVEAIRGQFQAF